MKMKYEWTVVLPGVLYELRFEMGSAQVCVGKLLRMHKGVDNQHCGFVFLKTNPLSGELSHSHAIFETDIYDAKRHAELLNIYAIEQELRELKDASLLLKSASNAKDFQEKVIPTEMKAKEKELNDTHDDDPLFY